MAQAISDRCPTAETLQAMLRGTLNEANDLVIRQHFNDCSHCQALADDLLLKEGHGVPDIVSHSEAAKQPWMSAVLKQVGERQDVLNTRLGIAEKPSIIFPDKPQIPSSIGRLEEFEILELVASGATGHLYRAQDTRLNRIVAIKVLRAELCVSIPARQRFLQEANVIARMKSDHIVDVYDVRESEGFPPYLVMEFINGNSLQQELDAGHRPDVRRAVELVCQVLSGLAAAHEKSVIHRDIKPGNILIDEHQNRARLVDFGLARLEEQSFDLTSPGSLAGTPAYIAPEQILDAHAADETSDVYSGGAVLYELLTGDVPFHGSIRMVLQQVLHDEPRPLRHLDDDIPRDLQTVCLKAMSKQPSQRYPSALAFRSDLQRWLDGLPVLARPVGIVGRLLRWKARSPTIANLVLVIAALTVTMIVMWGRFTVDAVRAGKTLATTNSDLVESNRLLNAQRRTAIEQSENASRLANLSFRVLNQLTFGIQNALADQPEQQRQLLDSTIAELEQLSATMAEDSRVRITLAVAYLRLGETLRKTGNTKLAQKCFQQSEDTIEALPRDLRTNTDVVQCRIWIELGRADVQRDLGQLAAACETYQSAASKCEINQSTDGNQLSMLHAHALAKVRMAELGCRSRAHAAPRSDDDLLSEAIMLLEQCLKIAPDMEDIRYDLAAATLGLADRRKDTTPESATALTFLAVDQLMSIRDNTRLRVEALAHSVEAIAFLRKYQQELTTAQQKRLQQKLSQASEAIDELLLQNLIASQMAEQLNAQLKGASL